MSEITNGNGAPPDGVPESHDAGQLQFDMTDQLYPDSGQAVQSNRPAPDGERMPDRPKSGNLLELIGPTTPNQVQLPTASVPTRTLLKNPFVGNIRTLNELYLQPERDDWLIENLLARREFGVIFGDSWSGKTFMAVDALMALAFGEPWCGGFLHVPKPATVVYAYGEGKRGVPHRFHARHSLYREEGVDAEPRVLAVPIVPQLFDREMPDGVPNFIQALLPFADTFGGIDLVAIDTLSRSMIGANENDTQDMTQTVLGIEMIQNALNCAVLVIHHENRLGAIRGNSVLRAAADIMLHVRKDRDNEHRLQFDKGKDIDDYGDLAFHFRKFEDSSVIVWDGEAEQLAKSGGPAESVTPLIVDVMMREPERRWTVQELAMETGKDKSLIRRKLHQRIAQFESCPMYPDREQKQGDNTNPTVYRLKDHARPTITDDSTSGTPSRTDH
ncbi:MAG: AAA family ATPase [Armatimonadota bacterium]